MGLKERLSAAKKKPKFPRGHFDTLPELYKSGMDLYQLADVFGCSWKCVRDNLLRLGGELRPPIIQVGYGEAEVLAITQSLGLKPEAQHLFQRYSIDVALPIERLAIEVLGQCPARHLENQRTYTRKRRTLQSHGWKVLWVDAARGRSVSWEYVGQAILAAASDKSDVFKQWLIRSDGTKAKPRYTATMEALTDHPVLLALPEICTSSH
jgi:very-short-patch-repair endonuclease